MGLTISDRSGGVGNAVGADFEYRLGVEFCVYILVGDLAGLAPGAVSLVQPQTFGDITITQVLLPFRQEIA